MALLILIDVTAFKFKQQNHMVNKKIASSDRILIFIPIYNCENQIVRVLSQFSEEFSEYFSEIIIINNRSVDNSESVIIKYLENNVKNLTVKIFRNKNNYNLGGSHKVAFDYAINNNFDYIVVLHGDDQGNISDLIPYIKDKTINRFDSMLGSRFDKKSRLINYNRFRIFGNYVLNFFISIITRRKLTDMGSGLNIYKIKYLQNKFYQFFPNNLTFNVYMLFYGLYAKSNFCYFPLTWREYDQVSNAKLLSQARQIVILCWKYVFFKRGIFNKIRNKYTSIEYESELIYSKN